MSFVCQRLQNESTCTELRKIVALEHHSPDLVIDSRRGRPNLGRMSPEQEEQRSSQTNLRTPNSREHERHMMGLSRSSFDAKAWHQNSVGHTQWLASNVRCMAVSLSGGLRKCAMAKQDKEVKKARAIYASGRTITSLAALRHTEG